MKPRRESRTAILVCMGRAVAHRSAIAPGFEDPTALALLPDKERAEVERLRAGESLSGLRGRLTEGYLRALAAIMAVRTTAVDEAIRGAGAAQLVILGAGLDGRAWRMPELSGAIVFEVDHPDSQRETRVRAAALTPLAREVRFVPVDFTRDRLDAALESAGHDRSRPTTWVWEGVVMYLTPPEVETTMGDIARLSAPGSRLIVVYHAPGLVPRIIGPVLRRLGEPLKSAFTPESMCRMLAAHRFAVRRDDDIPTLAHGISTAAARATRGSKHHRIVVADRVP